MGENLENDELDKELSVSVELTEGGVAVRTRSRMLTAIDRLGGNLIDAANLRIEGYNRRHREIIRGEARLIESLVEHGIKKIGASPEMAERALTQHFKNVIEAQENRDGVLIEAVKDISSRGVEDVPGDLNSEFLDRIERYSAAASTDELRHRWGRVLAAEVRKPGTFSGKVLRVVDELDQDTALLFEQLVYNRVIGKCIPKIIAINLDFKQKLKLVEAGLLIDPGLGHSIVLESDEEQESGEVFFTENDWMLTIPKECLPSVGRELFGDITVINNVLKISTYILTDAGLSVAGILNTNIKTAIFDLGAKVSDKLNSDQIKLFNREEGEFKLVHRFVKQ